MAKQSRLRWGLEFCRQLEVDKNPGVPLCIGCRWPVDDLELDLCCDCFDEETFKAMLRGEYGAEEQREARESRAAGR